MTELKQARICSNHLTKYTALTENLSYSLEVSGRFKYNAFDKSDYPVVGDYVLFRTTNQGEGIIERVLPRKSSLSRLGTTTTFNEQIIASNIDIVFICVSLNEDFHIRKVLNFLTMTSSDQYERILLLTKKDLCENIEYYTSEVKKHSDVPIIPISVYDDVTEIKNILEDKTGVFIGSSGVGKSTLINKLIGTEYFKTNTIRTSDAQGRHTTVHKELIHLDNNGAIIDSPGIRIINQYSSDLIEDEFSDVLSYASSCRFRDCTHKSEPGCKVQDAIEFGDLNEERYNQFVKAQKVSNYIKKQERIKEKLRNKRKK